MLRLCREFHVLPSQVYREDAKLLQLLRIEELGGSSPSQQQEVTDLGG